jgi:hypothetical protein
MKTEREKKKIRISLLTNLKAISIGNCNVGIAPNFTRHLMKIIMQIQKQTIKKSKLTTMFD